MAANKKNTKKVAKKVSKASKPAIVKTAKAVKKAQTSKKTTSAKKKGVKKTVSKKTNTKNTTAKPKAPKRATKKVAKAKKAAKKITKKVVKKVTSRVSKKPAKKGMPSIHDDNLIHGIEPYKEKAREKYMNPKQVKHFRNILLAWKTNLLDEVSKTIHLMQDENINHPDPNDRASQETDMSLELRNRDRERKLLKKIDSTVVRVDNNDYGWCDRCGIEIGIRRLEARPTAELCVDCKTLNEIKERQMI